MESVNPLVSVAVVTYNSSDTIIETLDSIAAQTYQNIELIVSDDCSSDNTVEIVRTWMDEHQNRFVRFELVTNDKNTGPSGNYNRAMDACQGEWLKDIDGDDTLLPTCILDCIDYIQKYPGTNFLFGCMEPFDCSKSTYDEYIKVNTHYMKYATYKEQLQYLMTVDNFIVSATSFINLTKLRDLKLKNDERIPMMEDWPKWTNILLLGEKFTFFDKVIVKYRIRESSISNARKPSRSYMVSQALFTKYYTLPYLLAIGKKREYIIRFVQSKRIIQNNIFWIVLFKIAKLLLK